MGGKQTGRGAAIKGILAILMMVATLPGPSGLAQGAGTPPGDVDLSVAVGAQPYPVPPGTVVAYEAVIRNAGSQVAADTTAVFEIPASSISLDGSSASCTVVGSMHVEASESTDRRPWTVTCDVGALSPGAELSIAFALTSGSPGTHIATARVFSAGRDGEPADNATETPLLVLPDAPEFTPAFQQPGPLNPSGRTRV